MLYTLDLHIKCYQKDLQCEPCMYFSFIQPTTYHLQWLFSSLLMNFFSTHVPMTLFITFDNFLFSSETLIFFITSDNIFFNIPDWLFSALLMPFFFNTPWQSLFFNTLKTLFSPQKFWFFSTPQTMTLFITFDDIFLTPPMVYVKLRFYI